MFFIYSHNYQVLCLININLRHLKILFMIITLNFMKFIKNYKKLIIKVKLNFNNLKKDP